MSDKIVRLRSYSEENEMRKENVINAIFRALRNADSGDKFLVLSSLEEALIIAKATNYDR